MGEVITKFKLETTQYDSKLRDATDRMKELMQSVQKAGGSMSNLSAKDRELASSFGTLSTGANNAKDKVRELTNDFNKMARQYNAMTAEMQKSDMGKMIAGQMQVMKDRLAEAKKELYDVGDAGKAAASGSLDLDSVLQSLGGQLGINTNLLSGLTTGTLATTAAVTAGVTAVAAATKAWADYNDEMNRQNTMTSVVTGLKGNAGEELTVGVRALARTYDVDFRQAIEAANTLIQQFGVSGEQALTLLQDGMQGMLAGDGGKLLSMIQQYAPSFRDAGIEASQLVAIIQNSEGGLFTDQNMSAITMGIKNLRLMTKQTSDALAQLGIDGDEMTRKLNDGSMTIFEAMQQVASAIENTGSSSQAAGQVMQQVFGRQGAMAGTKLGEAIASLNTNLEETKLQTGELGDSFVKLNEANMALEATMKEIFGMTGWEDMNNLLKTEMANTLTFTLEFLINIRDTMKEIGNYSSSVWGDFVDRITGNAGKSKGGGAFAGLGKSITSQIKSANSSATSVKSAFTVTTDKNGNVIGASRNGQDVTAEYLATQKTTPIVTPKTTTKGTGRRTTTNNAQPWSFITPGESLLGMVDVVGRSRQDVQDDLNRWKKKYMTATDVEGRTNAKNMQKKYEDELAFMDREENPFAEAYKFDFTKNLDVKPADDLAAAGEGVKESWQDAASALQAVGGALAGLDDPGAKIVGTVGAAIAQIALGFAQATAASSGAGVFGWIAAVAGGLTTMLSTISAIHSATGYASGGIVDGPSGIDKVPAMLTAGEVVLNHAQQNNLAAELSGNRLSGLNLTSRISGEDIILSLNNRSNRMGKGEYVTSKSRRYGS